MKEPVSLKYPGIVLPADIVAWFKKRKEQAELWEDWKDGFTRLSLIRKEVQHLQSRQEDDAETVLVCSLSTSPYQIKLESMLALGLLLEGWRIKILLRSRKDRWAHRCYNSFGLKNFCYWDDYRLSAEEKSACQYDTETYKKNANSFSVIKQWSYRQCWIGPQILASVSRGIMEGSPDIDDPEVRKRIFTFLPKTLETVRIAEHLLEKIKPQLGYIIEPNYAIRGALTDTAVKMKIPMIQVAACARDDALVFKKINANTRREHPYSLQAETFEALKKENWSKEKDHELDEFLESRYDGSWHLQSRNQQGVNEFDRANFIKELGLDTDKKIVVVFSHILWDANLFYGKDLFEDYGDWFVQTIDAARKNPEVNWIFKLHPANVWKRKQQKVSGEYSELKLIKKEIGPIEKLPGHIFFLMPEAKVSTRSLFDILDVAITVRGTISVEAPCFGKPVLTAGTGRAYGHGFTVDSQTREEYFQKLATIQEMSPLNEEQQRLARRHAHAIFLRRTWIYNSFQSTFRNEEKGRELLAQNLKSRISTVDQLHNAEDLRLWARWAGKENRIDYLYPDTGVVS